MKPRLKKLGKWALLLFIVLWAYGIGADSNQPYTPPTVGQHVTQDPVLVSDSKALGLDYAGVKLSFASSLAAPDIKGDTTVGLFTPPNSIQIQSGQTKSAELQTVAYEFMHYYWQNLPPSAQEQMATEYQTYYNQDTDFQTLTKYYVGTSSVIADERDSSACTLVQPYLLTSDFNSWCNQFIPNRSLLFQ